MSYRLESPTPSLPVAVPLVIAHADAHLRLLDNPGIYVGRFPIPALLRLVGHAATAEVTASGIAVSELVGLWTHFFQQVALHQPLPYYGAFSDYRWVKVADLNKQAAYRSATADAKAAYHAHARRIRRTWIRARNQVALLVRTDVCACRWRARSTSAISGECGWP